MWFSYFSYRKSMTVKKGEWSFVFIFDKNQFTLFCDWLHNLTTFLVSNISLGVFFFFSRGPYLQRPLGGHWEKMAEESVEYGCEHYKRKCKLVVSSRHNFIVGILKLSFKFGLLQGTGQVRPGLVA